MIRTARVEYSIRQAKAMHGLFINIAYRLIWHATLFIGLWPCTSTRQSVTRVIDVYVCTMTEMYVLLLALGRRQAQPTMKTRNIHTRINLNQLKETVAIVSWWQGKVPQTKSARFASRRVFCISNRDVVINVTPVTNYTDRIPGNLYGRRAEADQNTNLKYSDRTFKCRYGNGNVAGTIRKQ